MGDLIEALEVKEEFEYEHDRNKNQIYVITKTAMDSAEQMNKVTKYKRAVRRIERYEKLESLSGTAMNYPKFWDMASLTISDYAKPKLINISDKTLFNQISARFFQTVSRSEYQIVKIEGVQNQMLYDKYCQERQSVIKLNGGQTNEMFLYHGTKEEDTMTAIETEGFRKEFSTTHAHGFGTYFAKNAQYSVSYCLQQSNGIYKMFECKVICGEGCQGDSRYSLRTWPKKKNGFIYDTLVDSMHNPSIYVIHQNARAYPMHIIHFKHVPVQYNNYGGYGGSWF